MPDFEIAGIVPIIPTSFADDDQVDLGGAAALLQFAVDAGVCAVCLPAYASEFYKLREAERAELVFEAIRLLDGRLPVIAQVNHGSAAAVAAWSLEFQRAGASAISVAAPRLFALPERDLLRYFNRILEVIDIPLVIQDFNPGGATISVDLVKTLHRTHRHFRYLKLEEPLMAEHVRVLVDETEGEVGVIDGWGGTFMLELIEAGICGVMPGLGVSDLLQLVWSYARAGRKDAAYEIFSGVLPQITYSLQSMEFFHHAEKALLRARGVSVNTTVRDATMSVHPIDRSHIEFLNRKVIDLARRQGLGYTGPSVGARLGKEPA